MGPASTGGLRGAAQARSNTGNGVLMTPVPAGQLRVTGEGRPLEPGIRQTMETFFQADFSGVRVHEGPTAQAMGALAFTLGEELHFAPGLYDLTSRDGVALLGHELAHVVQQRDGRVANPYGQGVAIVQDPALEAEAERMGQRVADEVWSAGQAPGVGAAGLREQLLGAHARMVRPPNLAMAVQPQVAARSAASWAHPRWPAALAGGRRAAAVAQPSSKEGTFIGNPAKIHLHIDIGNPHLQIGGDRYNIKGGDYNGYSYTRCAEALHALTLTDGTTSGAVECRAWLEAVLDGSIVPATMFSVDNPGSVVSSAWNQGVAVGYPRRAFKKA
jgi:hypothetical protein